MLTNIPMHLSVTHTLVFGVSPTSGNPAPIVFGADGMPAQQMQATAAHFGEETAFVLEPVDPAADFRLRYFVPLHEMEMCVHATVGTITAILHHNLWNKSPIYAETALGILAINWHSTPDDQIHVMVDQFPPAWSLHNPSREQVAGALGISPEAIADTASPIQSVSTSRSKLLIPLNNWSDLDSLQPDFEEVWALCDAFNTTGFYPFTLQTFDTNCPVEARQFPKRAGYKEDPATGVAASALSAYLAKYEILGTCSDGWQAVKVGQGRAMGRPSLIDTEVYTENGQILLTRVGGTAAIVSNETLETFDSEAP